MLLGELVRVSAEVGATRARLKKIAALAELLGQLEQTEVPIAVAYLSGELPHDPIGVGWAALRDLPAPRKAPPDLTIVEVDTALRGIGATSGRGSQAARRELLAELFSRATEPERSAFWAVC